MSNKHTEESISTFTCLILIKFGVSAVTIRCRCLQNVKYVSEILFEIIFISKCLLILNLVHGWSQILP
jgi:hypothetical protein